MTRRRVAYLAAVAGCLVFYIAYREWLAWYLLLVILAVPWLSLLLSIPAMLTFRAEVTAPSGVEMGTRVQARLLGGCRLPVPPFQGRLRVLRRNTGESWQQKNWMALPTDHCGGLRVEPVKIRVCDYLGLFSLPIGRTEGCTVIVRPRKREIGELPSLERYLTRSWRPKAGGGFSENHELRLYRPGDSLNQVHWKLTAKTGKLILREPMEPVREQVLVTMNLRGTAQVLDRKFGQLLWLGSLLLEKNIPFVLRVLTQDGVQSWDIGSSRTLDGAMNTLLCAGPAGEGDARNGESRASWHYHIGGDGDEG